MNVVLAVAAVAAVATLVMEYGFYAPPVPRWILRVAETVIVAVFVLDRLLRLVLARHPLRHLRENWIDFALIAVAGAAVFLSSQLHSEIISAGALYVLITQAYILVHLLLRAVSLNMGFAGSGIHPTWLLIGSFAFLVAAGTGALMLDRATPQEAKAITFPDALFTATSATCVTGLAVRDTGAEFTPLGQSIILILIQCGGLGIMLFGTVFALLVGRRLSSRQSSTLGAMLSHERTGEMKRLALFVVTITLLLEAVGAAMFYPMFRAMPDAAGRAMTEPQAVFYSVFHSISSFCNAGFSLYRDNMMQGVRQGWARPVREHWQVLGVMAPLIVLGGLGFPVLQDCGVWAWDAARRGGRRLLGLRRSMRVKARLSLHSKIVLTASASLLFLGAAGLLVVEPPATARASGPDVGATPLVPRPVVRDTGDWSHLDAGGRLRGAVFLSVSARTAGFNTFDLAELSNAGKLLVCWLMLIGGSPASTAGGIKTVTFALMLIVAYGVIRRRDEMEAFRRSLSVDFLRKGVTVVVLYLGLVSAVTLLLCVALRDVGKIGFLDIFFESCSACGTVGLSTGVTASLNATGKYVIVVGMFLGRLGPLTLLLALTSKWRRVRYSYPREEIIIG